MTSPIKRDITIFQGETFEESVFITSGTALTVTEVQAGAQAVLTTKENPAFLQIGDYVYCSGFDCYPSLNDSFEVVDVSGNQVTIDATVTTVLNGKGRMARSTNISSWSLAGQIRQKKLTAVGNVVASTTSGSLEVLLDGVNTVDAGDYIVIEGTNYTDNNPGFVKRKIVSRGLQSVLLLDRDPLATVTQARVTSAKQLIGVFNFPSIESIKGKFLWQLSATPFQESEVIPISYDRDKYYYDVKYSASGKITTLFYGDVTVVPQSTPPNQL